MKYTKVQYDKNGKKLCTKCKNFKETNEFHNWSKGQDGLKLYCKVCVNAYDKKRWDPKRVYPEKYNEIGQIHCRNCGNFFDKSEMYISKNGTYKTSTYCSTCKPLLNRIKNIERYGITIDQYYKILEDQDYRCKLCNKKDFTKRLRLCIDHDHKCCEGSTSCGKCVRGLICFNCNTALGNVKDNIKTLQNMIDYLSK